MDKAHLRGELGTGRKLGVKRNVRVAAEGLRVSGTMSRSEVLDDAYPAMLARDQTKWVFPPPIDIAWE